MSDERDIFCKIIDGEMPSDKVYEDDDVYAFNDINPAAPTHILVIPKEHIASLWEAEENQAELLGKLMLRARDIAKEAGLEEDGFRLVLNTGAGVGQSVFHIHLHVIGGRDLSWPPG
ncbi:histidine triad nucleotide-binding protein [Persicimonas caeni]|uniref:Histidine triad nucleotide-binding protein n=1 Tax=Persicimonas caeni TaxID=2292766 RepID=A0A4Y6PRN6_PERCE|nr:histidine triad nucleotide-binding protein [Persicimonas caeni]QDG50988.1 histidine triad nucleotide-binding protein [Persicimonas caeni]QED32209.1 histidine triad nucleotide-binding protein [Persicimonas caeni]